MGLYMNNENYSAFHYWLTKQVSVHKLTVGVQQSTTAHPCTVCTDGIHGTRNTLCSELLAEHMHSVIGLQMDIENCHNVVLRFHNVQYINDDIHICTGVFKHSMLYSVQIMRLERLTCCLVCTHIRTVP